MALGATLLFAAAAASAAGDRSPVSEPALPASIWVYNNWSAYDELSDAVPLTEELAMRELDEILRLRKFGIHFDYYMMDAFWYDPDGGYRSWRTESWPHGPDRWLEACKANGIRPGLWFSTNTLTHMNPVPKWRSSLNDSGTAMSLSSGGFLDDFVEVLDAWYDRGIRIFKFDMADFSAAAGDEEKRRSPQEIRLRNARAFHQALRDFRRKHPDVVLVAFNGIVGDVSGAGANYNPFGPHWLDVFDALYSGDPRPSDVPEFDFWRAVDIYSDQMVRHFEHGGIPLQRIDSTSFMIGDTNTNYHRRVEAWQGSLLLMLAHGGRLRTVHGNLELLDDEKARWFAKAVALYDPLLQHGLTRSFGGSANSARPYGFGSIDADGAVYAVVNPAQAFHDVHLPRLTPLQEANVEGRVLFRDAGYEPELDGDMIRLGPGQFALVGFGRYADAADDLGIQTEVRIPRRIEPLRVRFHEIEETNEAVVLEAVLTPPAVGDLRVILEQRDENGEVIRSTSERVMGEFFTVTAAQQGHSLPVEIHHDGVIWSGLAWASGEIRHEQMLPHTPLHLRLTTAETDPTLRLHARLYRVEY